MLSCGVCMVQSCMIPLGVYTLRLVKIYSLKMGVRFWKLGF